MLRPMHDTDPQRSVDAPVRRALLELVVRGIALVAVMFMLVLGPSIPSLAWTRDIATVLVVSSCSPSPRSSASSATSAAARARPPAPTPGPVPAPSTRATRPWGSSSRAGSRWRSATALVVLVGPHFAEPDLEVRGAWWAFGIPVLLSGWIVATNGWLEATRDELARALGESDRRFRAYWADPGR